MKRASKPKSNRSRLYTFRPQTHAQKLAQAIARMKASAAELKTAQEEWNRCAVRAVAYPSKETAAELVQRSIMLVPLAIASSHAMNDAIRATFERKGKR